MECVRLWRGIRVRGLAVVKGGGGGSGSGGGAGRGENPGGPPAAPETAHPLSEDDRLPLFSHAATSSLKKYDLERIRRKNKAVVLHAPGKLVVENKPLPDIKKDEILIMMGGVAVSDTDLKLVAHGRVGESRLQPGGVILGTSGAGVVLNTLGNTKLFKAGDRVVLEPRSYCGSCRSCLSGDVSRCRLYRARGVPPTDGLVTEYLSHPVDFCHKIPSRLTMVEASFVPTMARCLYAYEKAGLDKKSNLLVMGCDVLGLTMTRVARALGIDNIFVIDLSLYRLTMAKSVGANYILNVNPYDESAQIVSLVEFVFKGLADVVYCSLTSPAIVNMALQLAKSGGIVILTSLPGIDVRMKSSTIAEKNLTLMGNWDCGSLISKTLRLVASGAISLDHIKPVIYPTSLSLDAFTAARVDIPECMAVFIRCNSAVQ